jgi:hypothetical protein
MGTVWAFLTDENNRGVLALIGGAVAAVCTALWAVFVHFRKNPETQPEPQVKADRGGVAIGGNVTGSTIRTGDTRER